jgi:hypothetical protein
MRRATRVRELLAFDLVLSRAEVPVASHRARPCDAPSLFSGAEQPLERLALAGFDEAGRGALAGPVVVGCVAIPAELLGDASRIEALLGGVDDSKKLTPTAREAAFAGVVSCARWAVGCASAREIDAVGIVEAARRIVRPRRVRSRPFDGRPRAAGPRLLGAERQAARELGRDVWLPNS